jgi:hypothetical protein
VSWTGLWSASPIFRAACGTFQNRLNLLKMRNMARPKVIVALFVDLAKLLLQFCDLGFGALQEVIVVNPGEQLTVLHDLHFKLYPLVFVRHQTFRSSFV